MESSIGILASLNGDTFPIVYHSCEDKTQDGIFEHSVLIHNTTYMLHTLTFDKEDSIPFGARAYSAKQIFEKYPDAEFICTGDNHTAFHVQSGKRHLINPGTPIIQSANMIDYSPVCYLIDDHTVEKIDLYNDRAFITNNHLLEKHERDNRIAAFIVAVKKKKPYLGGTSLSFFDNLAKTMEETQVPEEVKSILEELRMEVGNEE
jgi:hypothetical protein